MSAYTGRSIANLNAIDDFNVDNLNDFDLSADPFLEFTNKEFFDLDQGEQSSLPDAPYLDFDPEQEERARRQNATAYHKHNGKPAEDSQKSRVDDFALNSDFQFDDFSNLQNVVHDPSAMASMTTASPSGHYSLAAMSPASSTTPTSASTQFNGKRKVDPLSDPHSAQALEEATRLAAEEDKRRRNTAASARFRVKKKQREQALEKATKEMTDKVTDLEKKVNMLETENKWLKGLITEKNENRSDVAELYSRYTTSGAEARSTGGRTDGVGTSAPKNETRKV